MLDRLLGKPISHTLELDLSPLERCRLEDAIKVAIQNACEHRDWCNEHGLWVAGGISWPTQIDALTKLQNALEKLPHA